MSVSEPGNADAVGYKQPPRATRFQKGRSGNPRGRPRNRHRTLPHDTVLGQMVTIREDGRERRVTAAEAFLLHLTRRGMEGDGAAARAALAAIEAARSKRPEAHQQIVLVFSMVGMGVSSSLAKLGIAIKKYPRDKARVRWELKPWIIEVALARLGDRQLTLDEQRTIWEAAHKPAKVKWPSWWVYRG